MPDYKMLDEIDVLIFGRPTPESDRAMTEYIRANRAKQARSQKSRPLPSTLAKPKTKAKR
jgi:hypothetical protein